MLVTLLHSQSLNQPPRRALSAAITGVHVQICDVNPEQPINLFCKQIEISWAYVMQCVKKETRLYLEIFRYLNMS